MPRGLNSAALAMIILPAISLLSCGMSSQSKSLKSGNASVVVAIPNGTIAHLQHVTIGGAEVRHWMTVLGDGAALDPPGFKECISDERASSKAPSRTSAIVLLRTCRNNYEALRKRALGLLISAHWLLAQADVEGQPVTNSEVQAKVAKTERESYSGGSEELRETLEESGQTLADFHFRAEVELAAERVRRTITAKEPPITSSSVASYYATHKHDFLVPESRSITIVERYTKPAALKARAEIEHGRNIRSLEPLDETFKSTDEVEPLIFTSKLHTLVGPVKLPASWSVFEVTRIIPPRYKTVAEASNTIRHRLMSAEKRGALAQFISTWAARWAPSTSCSPNFVVPECSAYKGSRQASITDPFTLL